LLERIKMGLAIRVEDTPTAKGIKQGSAWAAATTFYMAYIIDCLGAQAGDPPRLLSKAYWCTNFFQWQVRTSF
jgi:hypothetical protein